MKSSAIARATIKALIFSCLVLIAVGLLFGAVSEFGGRVFENPGLEASQSIRNAFRFWTAWWFAIFGVISTPLWIVSFVYFVRRFVVAGFRMAAFGYSLALSGFFGVLVVLAYFLGAHITGNTKDALQSLAASTCLLVVGLLLGTKCRKTI